MPITRKFKCGDCGFTYAMEWAYLNHIKRCVFKFRKEQKKK